LHEYARCLGLVKLTLVDLGIVDPDTHLVEEHAWKLLARLTVLGAMCRAKRS
jgi:hypothetical protein